jgi:hypothetical protein
VKNIQANTIIVERGYYSTSRSQHLIGSDIKLITSADDLLIEPQDNFGFSGSIF